MAEAGRSLLLVLGSSTGGIGTHVAALAASCVGGGYDVTVCGPAATGAVFAFSATGARFVALPVELSLLLKPYARSSLQRLADSADVVHAHGLQAAVIVSRLATTTHVVATWHNAPLTHGPRRWLHHRLERVAARDVDVTIGASADLVDRATAAGGADVRFVPVAPPRLPEPSCSPAEVRKALQVNDSPVILAIGRLHPQKQFDVLVTAAAGWGDRRPRPVVVIAGAGPERDALQHKAIELDVDLRLLGRRSDVADLLGAADVVVLPSSWEARSLAAQEALMAGRALVASAVGGVPSLVGDAAVLVPAGDAAAITSAVERLLDDPAARRGLEQSAVAQAATWPTAEDVADRLMHIYAELAGR